MGADQSKELKQQRAQISQLEKTLGSERIAHLAKEKAAEIQQVNAKLDEEKRKANEKQDDERQKAEALERIRQEEREDKLREDELKEKMRQEDRSDEEKRFAAWERMEKDRAEKELAKAAIDAQKETDMQQLSQNAVEKQKQRDLEKYIIDQNIELVKTSQQNKFQLQQQLLESFRDSPDFKDILKISMESMSLPSTALVKNGP